MFGKNEIVGKKYFKDADGKYLVTSIFYTVQGEGPLAGYPAVFLRLAKCNLNCSFCDTYFDSGDWMTLEEIEVKILNTLDNHFGGWIPDWVLSGNNVALIITGGEPTLQALGPLVEYMKRWFRSIQVESNGILEYTPPSNSVLVVSPKMSEKTFKYLKPHDITLANASCLKFVLSQDGPYDQVPEWAFEWAAKYYYKDVFISPMNIYNEEPQAARIARNANPTSIEQRSTVEEVVSFWTPGLLNLEQNEKNHAYAADYCMMYGFRLTLQMHLYSGKA